MKLDDLKAMILDMFETDPEVSSISTLEQSLDNADVLPLPTRAQIKRACDALVQDGFLQRAGRTGYEMSDEEMLQNLPIAEALAKVGK
jgi:hypothetical protein